MGREPSRSGSLLWRLDSPLPLAPRNGSQQPCVPPRPWGGWWRASSATSLQGAAAEQALGVEPGPWASPPTTPRKVDPLEFRHRPEALGVAPSEGRKLWSRSAWVGNPSLAFPWLCVCVCLGHVPLLKPPISICNVGMAIPVLLVAGDYKTKGCG